MPDQPFIIVHQHTIDCHWSVWVVCAVVAVGVVVAAWLRR